MAPSDWTSEDEQPVNKLQVWWQTLRPKTLPAAIGPVALGQILVPPAHFSALTAMLCLLCALALQLAVNLANDLHDGLSGVDRADRLGPTRALQSGLLTADELRIGLAVTLGLAVATGLWLVVFGHWLLWVLGALALLGVLGYSGGTRPYASLGLGEPAVWFFFGPVAVLGGMLAQRSPLSGDAMFAAALVGLPVAAILVVNNLRDRFTDARAGKHTLAVRMGPGPTRALFALLTIGALLVAIPPGTNPGLWAFWIVTAAAALLLNVRLFQRDGAALNPLLGQTAAFSVLFAFWLALRFAWPLN